MKEKRKYGKYRYKFECIVCKTIKESCYPSKYCSVECRKKRKREYNLTTNITRIGMLRQWLNEDRIDDPKKMITNEDIKYWLKTKL